MGGKPFGGEWYWHHEGELHMDILKLLDAFRLPNADEPRRLAIFYALHFAQSQLPDADHYVIRAVSRGGYPPGAPPERESPGGGGGAET